MTNQERFLQALYADSEQEKLINFKLYPGFDRDISPDQIYGTLADAINKERMGLLKEIDLDEEEKNLKEFTIDDLKRI